MSHAKIDRMDSQARVAEIFLDGGEPAARIACEANLIPAPGRYLLAHAVGSDSALAAALFCSRALADGFLAAPPIPAALLPNQGLRWTPGTRLWLRGPLGRGFTLPAAARRIALVALDSTPARLLGLIGPAMKQQAAIVLLCEVPPADLPLAVEVQPLSGLGDAQAWADYLAIDLARESLPELKRIRGAATVHGAQALVRTPVPCGGLAECAICTVEARQGRRLACKDGPVFEISELA